MLARRPRVADRAAHFLILSTDRRALLRSQQPVPCSEATCGEWHQDSIFTNDRDDKRQVHYPIWGFIWKAWPEALVKDLKEKTIRGGFARLFAQGANFLLRLGSLMVLARLLGPVDFGLVGMVTAFTGVLNVFRDFGLSSAAVQHTTVTEEMSSTLFWINILVGAVLGLVTVAMAPVIAAFYHEPRLFAVTIVLATGLLFNAAGVQHSALLQRQMRFTAMAVISVVSLIIGTALAIGGAEAGYGYWALVAMTVTLPLTATIGFWIATGWIPGMPRRGTGIRSMMRFGGTLTLNGLIAYVAYNFEKVLLGRLLGSRCDRALRKGLPAHQHSDRKPEFSSRRGSVFGVVPTPGRSQSPQELLSEGLLARPRTDPAHHDCLRSFR